MTFASFSTLMLNDLLTFRVVTRIALWLASNLQKPGRPHYCVRCMATRSYRQIDI
ncbi:hypothetical protein I552_1508 [Mycobacterium xenopi 3993]|nr:hypothetical protein I552_1508 [Mycobacterium xenopi 3993]